MNIDLTKMNNLAKVEESSIKTDTYLMQSNKSTRKSDGNFHYTPTSTTRNYYDEEIIDRDGPFIIYQLETSMRKYFQNAAGFPTGINVGFSKKISSAFISYLKYDN
jgi:hypothetical protein